MDRSHSKSIRNIYIASVLLFIIFITGVLGFILIEGYSPVDAFFMTVISITTVGFEIVQPLSTTGKLFTAFLIIFSFGILGYFVTNLTKLFFEGVFRNYFNENKVKKSIQNLNDHVVICGYGRNGKQVASELSAAENCFVIIEKIPQIIDKIRSDTNYLYIEGDATTDDVLKIANIKMAKALITTLPNDVDNLYVVLTAKEMNPALTIISRASDDNSDAKLRRAGATKVIMPDKIGGQRMAKLVTQPDVVEFLEFIMLQGKDVSLEEVACNRMNVKFKDKSIKEFNIRNLSGANIVGIKRRSGAFIFNPTPEEKISSDDKLFVLGTPEQMKLLYDVLYEG
ncbi:MAG: potassium channel protein [Bacteroidia bacterium]|nr:potassium channel protein [Bacteroidia bacterium]